MSERRFEVLSKDPARELVLGREGAQRATVEHRTDGIQPRKSVSSIRLLALHLLCDGLPELSIGGHHDDSDIQVQVGFPFKPWMRKVLA